jgi:hypothetical protein
MDEEDTQKLVSYLKQLEPGFLPYDIFVQIARLVTLSIIEFVPLRSSDGDVEVLLLERPERDEFWPGEVHVPGTVVRPTDSTGKIYKAFERIHQDELRGTELSDYHFVGNILHRSKRGMEHAQVFWVEVTGEPKIGKFHPADKLPSNLIESQRSFIEQAVRSYKAAKT